MQDQLKHLTKLQEVDLRILEIRNNSIEYPKRIENLNKELAEEKETLESKENKLKDLNANRRDMERELETQEIRIHQEKDKLMTVKTNKEYHAVLKEIDSLKLSMEEKEYRIIGMMEEVEEYEKEVARARERFGEVEKKITKEVSDLEFLIEGFENDLVQQEKVREDVSGNLNPEVLEKYQYLQSRHPGAAVAKAYKGVCQGCNTKIRPQLYNLIIANEDLYSCPNCHRILIYDERNDN